MRKHAGSTILVTLCVLLMTAQYSVALTRADGEWWIQVHGHIDAGQHPGVAHAETMLKELWAAYQPTTVYPPRLLVIPSKADKWLDSWAMTLADGTIMMTESIFNLVYEGAAFGSEPGDSRLSFILAHELAHWFFQDHRLLGNALLFHTLRHQGNAGKVKTFELRADKAGLLAMTMAGYHAGEILHDHGLNFFEVYTRKIRQRVKVIGDADAADSSADVTLRAQKLKALVREFNDRVKWFASGVDAFQHRDYKASVRDFKRFYDYYPSREVANNLGLGYFQLAEEQIKGCRGLHLRLQTAVYLTRQTRAENLIIDRISREDVSQRRPQCRPDDEYRRLMKRAGDMFAAACRKDPGYWPAVINRAALLIRQKAFGSAVANLDALAREKPRNWHAAHNLALARFLLAPKTEKAGTISRLKEIPEQAGVYPAAQSNIRLLTGRTRTGLPAGLTAEDRVLPGLSQPAE